MSAIATDKFRHRFPQLASSLDPAGVKMLLVALEVRDAQAGEALVAAGTSSDALFLVVEGALDITMSTPAGERRLAAVGPGSYFGEASLVDPGPAGATIATEQGAVVLRLSRESFDELRRSQPAAAAALISEVLRSLTARVRAAAGTRGQAEG